MKTNVSTLLREFPKVRKAAFAGEDVIIETREGNLRLIVDTPVGNAILGSLKDRFAEIDEAVVEPTTTSDEWLTHS